MMNECTCKVGRGWGRGGVRMGPLSSFDMKGHKYDSCVSLGLSAGVHGRWGEKGIVNSERLINLCICNPALHPSFLCSAARI